MAVVAAQESRPGPAPDAPGDESGPGRRGGSRAAGWWLAALAALTVVLGLAIPLAPVIADDPVVTWPKAGTPAASTSLPLTPYRPLSMTADVPCAALRPGGDALRTQPESAGTPGRGLTAGTSGGRVVITSSGATVLDELLPLGDCTYRIVADQAGTRVERDGQLLVDRPGALVPQVAELATEAPGTPGLAATVHTDDRYSSFPSTLKLVLLVLHALALAATLWMAVRRWRGRGPGLERPRFHPADAVVLLVSAAWVVLGPLQNDDSWYTAMARAATPTGYIGNQIYMFNTTENPFVLSQYLMALWGHLGVAIGLPGWGLLWMRLLPLLLGLLTWWLLRTLLVTLLGRSGRLPGVAWALLLAHLAWWLPYGMALRPEVVIVPLSAGVLVLAELARRRQAVGPLIPATALAALAVSVSPSGLVAAAPVVVALPWLWRWLVARGWRSRLGAAGAVIAAGTIAIPIGFGDATLGDVIEATDVHSWYYLTFPWYEEWAHYRTMIETGTWGRRLPVLLTVVLLVVVSIGSGRGPAGGRLRDATLAAAVTTAVALGLLALGPTKWVNHFGAVAAPATVLLALTLLHSPLPRRAGALVTGASVLLISGATVLGFAGPNTWKPYSDRGQPFGDHLDTEISMLDLEQFAPHWDQFYLRDVWWWLLVAAVASGWLWWRRRAKKRTYGVTPERAVLVTATTVLVGLLIAVMVLAPVWQGAGWSVAGSQMQALTGRGCGLGEAATVMARTREDVGAPTTPDARTGDFALAANDPSPVPAPNPGPVWHDQVELVPGADPTTPPPGVTGLGTLTTGWFPLPATDPIDPEAPTHLVVPVAGNDPDRQRVVVQFGSGDPSAPVEAESVVATPVGGFTARQWQEIPVQLPGSRPTAARVVVEDRVAGPESALAVASPHLARMQPVGNLVDAAARPDPDVVAGGAFADQLSVVLWPCVDQVSVQDGIAPTPTLRLNAAENTPEFILTNPTYESWGGTMVQSERTWATVRPFSAVPDGGVPALPWGTVERIVYDHPTDGYDLRVDQVSRGGLERFATLASEEYSGREYLG